MAEGQFSPDLLLTVGADLTALRQQLATIQREIGAAPLNVGLRPQQTQETTRALNDQKRAVKELSDEVANLRRLQEAQARALKNDLKDLEQAYTTQRGLERRQAEQAVNERLKAQQRLGDEMAREYQNDGRMFFDVERQKTRILASETLQRQAQLRSLLAQYEAITSAQRRAGANIPPPIQQQIARVGGVLGGEQQALQFGALPQSPQALSALRTEIDALQKSIRALGVPVAEVDGVMASFFGKLSRYAQIAAGLTLVYGAMRTAFAGVQEFIEVDKIMARIASTMERGADRTLVLRGAYDLMVEANRKLGTSFSEAGGFILELEKSLGNNIEQIRAAFLPALTLVSIGEGNQTEILRTLIGLYKVFGDVLGNTTPQEKYLRISDALIASSAASIQDIDGFRTALQNVAPVARQSNVSLEETLALLVQLTNGMQSASRAGTGLRHLFDELQTKPQIISEAFGLPFSPDQTLNAAELLDQVIRKIRELGTDSLKARSQLQAAFPDERSRLAISTLVSLYPQYARVLDEVSHAAGRTATAQRELANTVSAAVGRLGGTLLDALIRNIATLTGVKPGDSAGLVAAIDAAGNAADRAGTATQRAIIRIQQLLAISGDIEVLREARRRKEEFENQPLPTQGSASLRNLQNRAGSAIFNVLPSNIQDELTRLQRQLPENVQARQQQAEAFALPEAAGLAPDNSQHYAASLRLQGSLARELEERKAELLRQINLEYQANSRDVDIKQRIAAADALLAVRTKERAQAERDFLAARGLPKEDIARTEQARGGLQTALQAERRARQQVDDLRREDTINQIKALNDQEDRMRKFGHLVISTQENITARRKVALGDEVAAFQASLDAQLKAATGNLDGLTEAQQTQIGQEEYRVLLLEALRKQQVAGFTEAEALTNSLSGQASVLGSIFRQLEAIGEVKIAPDGFQTLDGAIQTIVDKALGIDKVVDANRELAATMGLVGAEAARAAVAARFGFESFEAMLELANQVRERQRQGNVFAPLTPRENAALIGAPAAQRTFSVTQEGQLKQAEADFNRLEKAQRALRDTFGQTSEEALRQSLALARTGDTFEELAQSTDEADRKLATWISRIARATIEGERQTEILSLMAAGFDEVTASMIATQNAQDRIDVGKLRQAGQSLEEFNTRAERTRAEMAKIAEESARLSGDPFAFYLVALKNASDQSNEFWASLKSLAEDTAKSMSQSLSDFFFNTFEGNLNAGKDAWKSFLGSMERALADFMSKQLVRSFLNILTGGGGDGQPAGSINLAGGAGGVTGLLGGVASGFGSIGSNFTGAGGGFAGIGAALFGLPATPSTVQAGLQPSNPDLEFAGLAPTQIQTVRQATSGIIGTGGQASRDLAMAGVIAAAYTASQSVIKLTSEISTERDRNSGTGGIAGTAAGGILGGLFFGQSGAAIGAGAGGLLGSYLGGLFGSDQSPAGRFDELARTIGTVQTALEASVNSAKTFTDLYNVLLGFQGGGALANATRQPVGISAGGQPISSLSQEAFLTALRANPSSLIASVQAGVSPELLGPLNQEVVQTILAKVAALDSINQQITRTIAEISALSIAPATGIASLDTLKEQAINFRATVDQLVAANTVQISSLEDLLRVTTDPAQILQYTTEIKALIQDRYQTETQLVQQFAGQLDSLASSLKAVGKSIEEQIFNLQLSNFGPTNPLQGFQLAQGRFNEARAAFQADPTAENAQAVQAAVDPLLKAASEVFTRPSPEYRAIFAEVIDALETVKISVDSQANDIQGALQAALGTSISIQDLTQRNTAAMAADMRQLLAIVQAQAAAAGVGVGAGSGFLNPQTNPPPSGQVTAPTGPAPNESGSTTGAVLAAVGTIGALAGPLLTIADKLGALDYLKNAFAGLFTSSSFTPTVDHNAAFDYSSYFSGIATTDLGYTYTPYDYGYLSEGGPVPGSGMGDTVRAMLEPGEFVVRREAAARNRRWLEEINGPGSGVNRRGIMHFQDGGMVPSTTSSTGTSPSDVAILLYLQSITGGTQEQAQALLAELLRQAEQNAAAASTTPTTVSGGTTSGTPPVTPDAISVDPTVQMLREIQTLLGAGRTVSSLFGDVLGLAPGTAAAISSTLGALTGGIGLFTGIANEDPFAAATGGLATVSGIYNLLASQGLVPTTGALVGSLAGELGIQLSAAGAGAAASGIGAAIVAAIQIAQIASNSNLSDEEKAIQATKAATTAIAVALAGPTFGASLAVLQIWDFVERMRAGQPLDQALVSANDPTALLNILGSDRDLSISGNLFAPSKDWVNFIPKLYENAGTQGEGFEMLLQSLPYVKSKEELGQLLNHQKNWVSTITGIPLSAFGGADSPYSIQTIPGIGPETHGQETVPVDWAETSNAFQQLINVYKALLPGMEITGGYGSAEGSFSPEAYGRLWSQFRFGDPGSFSYATYAGAPMPFELLNADQQFINTEHNESGANFVLNPNWIPYGTAQVYDGVDSSGMRKFTSWTGWQPALGIRFDPQFGDQVWVAPGGPIPQTIESLYSVSPEWKILQALYGLPPVVPIPTPGGGMLQPTGYVPPTPEQIAQTNLQSAAVNAGFTGDQAALEYQMWLDFMNSQSSPGGMAAGGWVPGVSQGRDSIPMWLEPGEFVVPRAVAKAHAELLMGLLDGGTWDSLDRSGFGRSVSSMARDLVGGSWDGLHRADAGSTISAAARSGDYRGSGGVSSVALHIAEGAIRIDGARDPKVVSRDVLEAIEQNIRTGRLGQVIASRVRPQRSGV